MSTSEKAFEAIPEQKQKRDWLPYAVARIIDLRSFCFSCVSHFENDVVQFCQNGGRTFIRKFDI